MMNIVMSSVANEPSRARGPPSRARPLARLGSVTRMQGSARARLGTEPEISGSTRLGRARAELRVWLGSARWARHYQI